MNRREVIAGLALPLFTCSVWAQQSKSLPRVGLLFSGAADSAPAADPIAERLRQLGYIDGKTIKIERRFARGRLEDLPALARELVALNVDVLVSVASSATVAAKGATAKIPIVMVHVADPVGAGLVDSLNRPGGNITGTTSDSPDIVPKAIELLREIVPARHLAMLAVPSNIGTALTIRQAETAAAQLAMALSVVGVERAEDLDTAFDAIVKSGADSLLVAVEPMLFSNRARVIAFADQLRLPAVYLSGLNFARSGGLLTYSPVFKTHFLRAAEYVDRILKGAKAAELPVEGSSKFELIVNLKTAKALGLTIPPSLLARADEVIE
jgi:ABC-type uncharacterized transport system substrate-binding protein